MLHYLNDFLAVISSRKEALQFSENFSKLCAELSISINEKKSKKDFIFEFLGIELDTIAMEARFFPEKLQKVKNLVTMALQKTTLTQTEPDFLLGFLFFAAKVVVSDRAF